MFVLLNSLCLVNQPRQPLLFRLSLITGISIIPKTPCVKVAGSLVQLDILPQGEHRFGCKVTLSLVSLSEILKACKEAASLQEI